MSNIIPKNDNVQTIIDRMLSECTVLDDFTFCSQYHEFKKLEDLLKKLDIHFLTESSAENNIENIHVYFISHPEPIQINIKDNLNEFIDVLERLSENPDVDEHFVYIRMELEIFKSLPDIDWGPFRRVSTKELCENIPQHRSIAIAPNNDKHIIPDDYLLGTYNNYMFVKLDDYISNLNILNNSPLKPAISKNMKLLYEIIKISKLDGYIEKLNNLSDVK